MADEQGLWEALRERRVIRTLLWYLAGAWLVLQVAEIMADIWELPSWVTQAVFVLLVLGLPITAVLAWVFQVSYHGVIESDGEGFRSLLGRQSRPARWLTGAAASVLFLLLAFGALHLWPDADLDPRLRHMLGSEFRDRDAPDNLAYAVYGFNAPAGVDPRIHGRFVIDRYNALAMHPGSGERLEFTVDRGDGCILTHGCGIDEMFEGLSSVPALLESNAVLLARYRDMRRKPVFTEVIRPTADSPPPPLGELITAQHLVHRKIVYDMVEGRVAEGWAELEAETSFHRAMLASANHLLMKMVALRLVEEDLRLRVVLLAKGLTQGAGPPPERLGPAERSAITAIRFELESAMNFLFDAMGREELAEVWDIPNRKWIHILPYRRNATANHMVPSLEMMEASLLDTSDLVEWAEDWVHERPGFLEYLNNGVGVLMFGEGPPPYIHYLYRIRELDRNILLARIGERMIAERIPPTAAEGWLQSLPPEYRDPFTGERASWADGVLSYPDPELGWEVRRGLDVPLTPGRQRSHRIGR